MKIKHLCLLVCLNIAFGCDKAENNNELSGTWNLIEASGTIAGIVVKYPKGKVVWNFSNKLTIQNDYTGSDISFPSGTHIYSTNSTIEGLEMTLDGSIFAYVTKTGNDTLMLNQNLIFSDGVNYLFVK